MSVEVQTVADVRTKADNIQPLFPQGPIVPEPILRSMQDGNHFSAHTYPQPEELHPRRPDTTGNGNGNNHHAGDQQTQSSARVPLPPRNSQPSQASPPSGPMSSNFTIPPRPRPGRKPIPQEDAADRRRLQNRVAQRNFRDKRQQKLHETQMELEERKQDYQERINELERQLAEVRREKKAQDAALKAAEHRADEAEKKLQQSQLDAAGRTTQAQAQAAFQPAIAINTTHRAPMGAYGGSSVPTPPEEVNNNVYYDETDYTNAFRFGQQPANPLRPTVSNDSMDFSRGMDTDDRCGFCTDDQNCACKNEARQNANETCVAAAVGPGTCDACRRDPDRARQCQELANGASFGLATRPSNSEGPRLFDNGQGGMSMSMAPPSAPRKSCSAMVDSFRQYGERNSSISDLFGGQVRAYPVAGGGYEIEDHEAAQVLQSLSRRGTMVSESSGQMSGDESARRG
ncbi:hypothetical protein LTR85_007220 [Meristemomyces frigidus]|nr:hypothetical protein LTR85_007220 [Meristemomyces frigidus]